MLLILGVRPGSPAEAAGLQSVVQAADGTITLGDVLLRVGERTVRNAVEIESALGHYKSGDPVILTLRRQGTTREVRIALE